eukprot:s660_g26.t3
MADRPSKSHALWRLRALLRHVDVASSLEAGLAGHHADAWAAADAVACELLRQLTPDEIAGLIGGRGFWSNGGVPRLKLPALQMTDGPSGARGPLPGLASACVPCGAALGATWDPELCRKIGAVLGQETKVKGAHILLGPTVNLQRHPLGGRNFECFSEDPQLSAALAAAYIEGVQEQGVACCVKHLVANDQEHRRSYISAEVSEKALREVYLVPFEAAVQAGCMAVMTGYNRVNGIFCSENRFLLQEILRKEWGFRGCVMSDWTGTHSVWGSLEAGLDLEMPEAPGMFYKDRLSRLFHGDPDGRAEMTKPRALAVLRVMARLGLQPGMQTPAPAVSPNSPELRELLAIAAAESVVLLKNGSGPPSGGPLPLSRGPVAVLGPSGRRLTTQGGGSAAVEENLGSVNLVEALRRRLGEHAVQHGRGTDAATRLLPPPDPAELRAVQGEGLLKAEFMETSSWQQLPDDRPVAISTTIRALNFGFFTGIYYNQDPPSRNFRPRGPWAVRYCGQLTSRHTGRHQLSLAGTGRFRLLVRGQCLIDAVGDGESLEMGGFLGDLGTEHRAELELSGGEGVEVCVLWAPGPIRPSRLHVGFRQKPWASEAELQAEAVKLARGAETAVVVLGSPGQDSEGRDQSFEVCGLELVRAVAAVQPRTVVCLNVGSAKQLPPELLKLAGAMLVCWLGGQEAAEGLARVLCGEGWGASGRLPVTWPYKLEDTVIGSLQRYPGVGTQVFYSEGVLLGHRWFQSQGISPQFCFGHGLAYTSFEYSDAELRELRGASASCPGAEADPELRGAFQPEAELELVARIRNSGARAGKELLQERRSGDGSVAWRLLLGFTKVALHPGEAQLAAVKFLAREATRHWCEIKRTWVVEPCCDVLIASSGEEQWRTVLRIATPATA